MFGRDPITPIAKLLEPKLKFYGEKGIGVNMDTLRKLYTVVAENIRKAPRKTTPAGNCPYEIAGQRLGFGKRSRISGI